MIRTITSLLKRQGTLHAKLELDHIELCAEQMIMGLQLTWRNGTTDPLEIRNVVIKLFHHGKKETPLQLIYNGRFVRIPYQKAVTKIAGATSFSVNPGSSQMESLRFVTRDILDPGDGIYHVELHSTVDEGTYLHGFDIKVNSQVKYRTSGQEVADGQPAKAGSNAFARALRIGVGRNVA